MAISGGSSTPWTVSDGPGVAQSVLLAAIAGPYAASGSTLGLVGFPGGAPQVPAGSVVTGQVGSTIRIQFFATKTGTAGTGLNVTAFFGNLNSFSDTTMIGQPLANSGNTFAEITIDIYFPTATSFYWFWRATTPSGVSFYVSGLNTTAVNVGLPMFLNVGYGGATAGDGVKIEMLRMNLFR